MHKLGLATQSNDTGGAAILRNQIDFLASQILQEKPGRRKRLVTLIFSGQIDQFLEEMVDTSSTQEISLTGHAARALIGQISSLAVLDSLIKTPVLQTALDSESPQTLHMFGTKAFELEDFNLAAVLFEKQLAVQGPTPAAYAALCNIATNRRDWEALAKYAMAWRDIESQSTDALKYALAAYAADQRQLSDAQARDLFALVKTNPSMNPWAAISISKSLSKLGHVDASHQVMLRAAQNDPANLPVQQELSLVEGQVADQSNDQTDADYIELIAQIDREFLKRDSYRAYAQSSATAMMQLDGRKLMRSLVSPASSDLVSKFYENPLRSFVSRKFGQTREAEELKQYGAASWRDLKPLALRLARNVDGFASLTLQNNPRSMPALRAVLFNNLYLYEPSQNSVPLLDYIVNHWDELPLSVTDKTQVHQLALSVDTEHFDQHRLPHLETGYTLLHYNNEASGKESGSSTARETVDIQVHYPDAVHKIPLGLTVNRTTVQIEENGAVIDGFAFQQADGRLYPMLGAARNAVLTGSFRHVGSKAAIVRNQPPEGPPKQTVQTAMFVPASPLHYRNFFHFMGQMLPRLLEMWHLHADDARYMIVPEDMPGFARVMLQMAGIPEDRLLFVKDTQKVLIEKAYVANRTTHDWQCTTPVIEGLRSALRLDPPPVPRRKLFLTRPTTATSAGRARTFHEEAEYAAYARKNGFEVLDPSAFDLHEQRKLFASAKIVVGATGAALSNVIFMQPGTHAVVVTPRETCRTYYPGLCTGDGPNFHWIAGNYVSQASEYSPRFPHLPFSASLDQLKDCLHMIDGTPKKKRRFGLVKKLVRKS